MRVFGATKTQPVEREEFALELLSEELQISQQTLVRWVDRHLIDGTLRWSLTDDNEEVRVISLRKDKVEEIRAFAVDYRNGHVTRREARRILKMIDRNRIKKMVRTGDIETVEIDEEQHVLVSSIEDYLINLEAERGEGE